MTSNLPALQSEPSWSRELVKDIAMDIGKDVCVYVEVMYPAAVKAASSTFLLSLRNSIHNEIIAALDGPTDEASIRQRLADRKKFRREWKAQWKKIRATPPPAAPDPPEAGMMWDDTIGRWYWPMTATSTNKAEGFVAGEEQGNSLHSELEPASSSLDIQGEK